ncbi:MAG: hypothetical protein HQM12_19180 [SAR324 cluster bacterium]|nr:hypothetical protein [SAR324 cluster bacterium]
MGTEMNQNTQVQYPSAQIVAKLLEEIQRKIGMDVHSTNLIKMVSLFIRPKSEQIGHVIKLDIAHYFKSPHVQTHFAQLSQIGDVFDELLNVIPSFLFLISGQLASNQTFQKHSEYIRLLGVRYLVGQEATLSVPARFFISTLSPDDSAGDLHEKAFTEDIHSTYFPYLIRGDLYNFIQTFQFLPGNNKQNILENHYLAEGIFAIFFKYYFDLLAHSTHGGMAENIYEIFSNFFTAFMYKKRISIPPNAMTQDLLHNEKAHPYIKKYHFDMLRNTMPLLITPKEHQSLTNHQLAIFQSRLDTLRQFPPAAFTFLLLTLHDIKGGKAVKYLVDFLLKEEPNLFERLQLEMPVQSLIRLYVNLLDSMDEKFVKRLIQLLAIEKKTRFIELRNELLQRQKNNVLLKLVEDISLSIFDFRPPPKVINDLHLSEESRRLKDAQNKLEALSKNPDRKKLTQKDIEAHIEECLNRLYETVRKPNAMTAADITAYLKHVRETAMAAAAESSEAIDTGFAQNYEQNFINAHPTENFREIFGLPQPEVPEGHMTFEEVEADPSLQKHPQAFRQFKSKQVERPNIQVYKRAIRTVVNFELSNAKNQKISIPLILERFLTLPIGLKDKLRFLRLHISDKYIPDDIKSVVYAEQQRQGLKPVNPLHVFDKDGQVKPNIVYSLLKLMKEWEGCFIDKVIMVPIAGMNHFVTLFDFLSFPLAPLPDSPLPEKYRHLSQHLKYIKMLIQEGVVKQDQLEKIKQYLHFFPKFEYTQTFQFVHLNKIDRKVLQEVYVMWNNRKLYPLRKDAQTDPNGMEDDVPLMDK